MESEYDGPTGSAYWDRRSALATKIGRETFYTITPLPLYIKRRSLLVDTVDPELNGAKAVLDFGCGDGWYISHFRQSQPDARFFGIDTSSEMLSQARLVNPGVRFWQNWQSMPAGLKFDVIYTFATLAHIPDDELPGIFEHFASRLSPRGNLVIFEQTAPFRYSGKGFIRRTIKEYLALGRGAGLVPKKQYLVDFPAHRFFERYLAKLYFCLCPGKEDHEKRLRANTHRFYRTVSRFFLLFDLRPIREAAGGGWGNALIIYSKGAAK